MDQFQKELLVSRILSGTIKFKINKKRYTYRTPSQQEFYAISEYGLEAQQEALSMGMMPEAEHFSWLLENKIWSTKEEERYNLLVKELDTLKVNLYESYYKKLERLAVKRKLEEVKQEMSDLYMKKHSKDDVSADYYVRLNKFKMMVALGLYSCLDRKLFKTVNHVLNTSMSNIIDAAVMEVSMTKLNEVQYRELCRTDPWKSYWSCREGNNLFNKAIIDLSEEQRQLILCSFMYDNIYKHSECPTEKIILDDDALDGWMIIQKRKAKNADNQSSADSMIKNEKIKNSQEVFIMTGGSKEELEEISNLNDAQGDRIKKERFKHLEKHGEVEEQDMPDSKRRIREIFYEQQRNGGG